MQDSTGFIFNVTSWIVSSASEGSWLNLTSLLAPTSSTIISGQLVPTSSTINLGQMTSNPSAIISGQMTSTSSAIISGQLTSLPSTIITGQITVTESSVSTESLSTLSQRLSQATSYPGSFTSTSSPSATLLPSLSNPVSAGPPQQYSSTLTSSFNESVQMTQTLSPSGNDSVLSPSAASTSFPAELTSSVSSGSSPLETSSTSSILPTSFLATPSNITTTETNASEALTEPLKTSMMQTETYFSVFDGVIKSLSELNSTVTSKLSNLNISNIFPTAIETSSNFNSTDAFNSFNSTLGTPQLSETQIESESTLRSPYGGITSSYYEDINATESVTYESSTTDFWNVTEEIPYENSTDTTEIWNTTDEDTTTTFKTLLTTLRTSIRTSTVTTTASTTKTTTRAAIVTSTTEVPIHEYALTVPVIIGITVGLVVLTALIFVMLLWRRKVKKDHSVNVPRRYAVNSRRHSGFKHHSIYGGRGEQYPHFAPVYYGEADQTEEQKPVRISSYKIRDASPQELPTIDQVKLRSRDPVNRVEELRLESVKDRHSFPYEKNRLHFYSQYGKSPREFHHTEALKGIANGDLNKHGMNGNCGNDKPNLIKMNGVHNNHTDHSGSPETPRSLEDTKL